MPENHIFPNPTALRPSLRERRKKKRDLVNAVTLRPAEVFELYGIPSSTLCQLCKHPDPEKRLPSMLTPGRSGRKGLRLINHCDLKAWLNRWRMGSANLDEGTNPQAA